MDEQLVPGSSNVHVVKDGRVGIHRMYVAAYEVTDHQIELLTVTGQDAGYDFNVFIASASVSITIALALYTTVIPDPRWSARWHGGLYTVVALCLIFFFRWRRKKSLFKGIIAKIRGQKLYDEGVL